MTRTSRILVFAIVAIVVAGTVTRTHAAPAGPPLPRLVKVAGVLPGATGTATVRFAIYADQASEAPLWTEKQRVVVGEAGRFAVYLGASQPDGLPVELFATGDARWLGVQAEGQPEQARVLLVSVPYALKAVDADTVGGKPLSAFVLAGDTTGVGADGLNYVDTRVLKQGLSGAGPLPQGVGTPGYLGVFLDTNFMGNSVVFQNGTSIGVGTTTPAAAFHSVATAAPGAFFDVYSNALGALPVVFRAARGTPASPSAVQTDDILGGLAVRGYGATTFSAGRGQVMFKAAENWTDAANGTYLQLTTTPIGSATWAERMRIDPSGKVGIGTTTPAQALSVAGVIESTTGGFKFPNGTTQATAAGAFGDPGLFNTAVGTQAGGLATTGAYNAAFGYASLSHNTTGNFNTASGSNALYSNTTGSSNAAFGSRSLVANTTGSANSAFGEDSLAANTTGSSNTASGASALYGNTTGFNNTASGSSALQSNTTGNNNTASGVSALASNTTGTYNTASGVDVLRNNTTGTENTASGYSALYLNTTGTRNTAGGEYALYANTTGSDNTASGVRALSSNTTGNSNTASGENALYANTTGYYNMATGFMALNWNTTGFNNTASGASALRFNTTGSSNTASGYDALSGTTTGLYNTAVGVSAGHFNTSGHFNTYVGYDAGPDNAGYGALTYAAAIGAHAVVTQSSSLVLGGVNGSGYEVNVGIGTSWPNTTLQVVGDIRIGTSGTNGCVRNAAGTGILGTCSSDGRLKMNVRSFEPMLDRVVRLQPVRFNWNVEQFPEYHFGQGLNSGLIAQQVEQVFPDMVGVDEKGYRTVAYNELPLLTLAAVRELKAENDALRALVEAGDAQMRARDEQVRRLTDQVTALTRAVAALGDRRQ